MVGDGVGAVRRAAAGQAGAEASIAGAALATPLYWRFDLEPGSVLDGPAIIAEDETSTVVGANFRAVIDALGYIVLNRK